MITALIVAAGQGARMGGPRRKQYIAIDGRPILQLTLKAFDACRHIDALVLVVPGEEIGFCRDAIVAGAIVNHQVTMVAGGERRQDSVYLGLQAIRDEEEAIVLIHDGVRPFVTRRLIEACIAGAREWNACVPALEVTDTIKQINSSGIIETTLPRETLRSVQTPQAFRLAWIKDAHEKALQMGWQATDDAHLVERMGKEVHVVPGDANNIKITTPDDLQRAEFFYRRLGEK